MPPTMRQTGNLRIGDHQNAIAIIALSQSNPLKAIAEFVENSIDAKATRITIIRGKEKGRSYLKIQDDGQGVPRDEEGLPNFKYVATHICDSIKRRLKGQGERGIQGEFGIGLLSFWTVGEELVIASTGANGKAYQMRMTKGRSDYAVEPLRRLFADQGTELHISPLLSGLKGFSGEKIQWYLASELRDRIRLSGVQVRIIDRAARAEYQVEPRQFSGQLLHRLPPLKFSQGDGYLEIYLSKPDSQNHVGLYRSGTRVIERITDLEEFNRPPWNSGYLQGIVDGPFLSLTPGTRLGLIRDELYASFCEALLPIEEDLHQVISNQKKAEEEKTSQETLKSIQKAFKEALLALPEEEYDWFDMQKGMTRFTSRRMGETDIKDPDLSNGEGGEEAMIDSARRGQRQFFEFVGPLFKANISPASCVVPVGGIKNLRAVCRDRKGGLVEEGLSFEWRIVEGTGEIQLHGSEAASAARSFRVPPWGSEIATFVAPQEPALVRIGMTVRQGEVVCTVESLVTVTDSLLPRSKEEASTKQGLPGYTFERAPGELWRSRYQAEQNVIVINNAHRDFVYASRNQSLKLRYICRLFAKELVQKNFPGVTPDELLERMIELSLYTEENLK